MKVAQGGNITALVQGWEVGILSGIFMEKIPWLEDHTTCEAPSSLKLFGQGGIQWVRSGTAILEDKMNKTTVEGVTDEKELIGTIYR